MCSSDLEVSRELISARRRKIEAVWSKLFPALSGLQKGDAVPHHVSDGVGSPRASIHQGTELANTILIKVRARLSSDNVTDRVRNASLLWAIVLRSRDNTD